MRVKISAATEARTQKVKMIGFFPVIRHRAPSRAHLNLPKAWKFSESGHEPTNRNMIKLSQGNIAGPRS
jgi:hypothetical protein